MKVERIIGGLIVFEVMIQRRRTASPSQAGPRLWNLSRFGITQPAAIVSDADQPAPAALFATAVRDNSNLEMDWLWLATQVTHAAERRYCLERALYINPHSDAARQGLATPATQATLTPEVPAFAPSGDA